MGNCQAVDAATLVVQHPSGKVERFYLPVSASEIMKMNPGHYVALLLSTTLYPSTTNAQQCPNNRSTDDTHTHSNNNGSVRLTRIKLLKPTDTLALGHVYRLITTQEVMKGLRAKKQAKLMQNQSESGERLERAREKQTSGLDSEQKGSELDEENQMTQHERNRPRAVVSVNSATVRSRTWQPSLKSISESSS